MASSHRLVTLRSHGQRQIIDRLYGLRRKIYLCGEQGFPESGRELGDARGELGRAFEAESLNEIALGELSVRADKATATMKEAFEAALRRIHATLDPKQRAIVADLLTRGPRRSTAYRGSF